MRRDVVPTRRTEMKMMHSNQRWSRMMEAAAMAMVARNRAGMLLPSPQSHPRISSMSGQEGAKRQIATALPRGYEINGCHSDTEMSKAPAFVRQCFLSVICQVRREKISQRMKLLQDLVPGCNKVPSAMSLEGSVSEDFDLSLRCAGNRKGGHAR